MEHALTVDLSRREVFGGTMAVAVGALGASAVSAQAQAATAVDPAKVEAVVDACNGCQVNGAAAFALSAKQLADGDTKMARCNQTCTNMLAVTKAMHTVAIHNTADPELVKLMAAATHQACLECEAVCNEFDNPTYQSCADVCRHTAAQTAAVGKS
jgi:hypothetical protein